MPDDHLSQNQIDALFAELGRQQDAPEEATQERFRSVRPYDFRHPSKLSKEQLRTLQMIFESFARQTSTALSGILRSQVHISLVSLEQAVFEDYTRTLPSTTLLNIVTMEPLPGTMVIEYDLNTAFVMLDRLLGGIGKGLSQEREVSEIEETLLHSISGVFTDAISEAWQHISPLQAKLQRLEYSSRFLQVAPMNEVVVLLLFDLKVQDRSTTLSMCIPYTVLEPIAAELNMQALFMVAQSDTSNVESLETQAQLQRVTIPLVAVLGTTDLPVEEIQTLQVDDVIRLDGLRSDPVVVTVNQKPTYVGRPGLVRNNIAIQVLGVVRDEEEVI